MNSPLVCFAETQPRVDGMRTICGTEFGRNWRESEALLQATAVTLGWRKSADVWLCPTHAGVT